MKKNNPELLKAIDDGFNQEAFTKLFEDFADQDLHKSISVIFSKGISSIT